MRTFKISKEELKNKTVLSEGYKVINYDLSTNVIDLDRIRKSMTERRLQDARESGEIDCLEMLGHIINEE